MTTKDRRPYLSASNLTQELLDEMSDNLNSQVEIGIDIETPFGDVIRASNRNKYIDGIFYSALLTDVPEVLKTIGEWLQPGLEFSNLEIALLNVDGRFNRYAPGGANYSDWTNQPVTVKIGLFQQGASYQNIFSGFVSDVSGFGRNQKSIVFRIRDRYDKLNTSFPQVVFSNITYPFIEDSLIGTAIPLIWGDFTTATRTPAMIPAYVVNGIDNAVIGGPNNDDDLLRNNIQLVISENANFFFDNTEVYYRVDEKKYVKIPSSEITNIAVGNNAFEIIQVGSLWLPEPDGNGGEILTEYRWSSGDEFFVKVKGKYLGGSGWDTNVVAICQDILISYGGVLSHEFDANWDTYRTKNSPSQSAIANIEGRAWVREQQTVIEYSLQLLEQVRLEYFISRGEQKIKINSLHFEDIDTAGALTVKNWDFERNSLEITTSDTHFINRAQATYDQNPALDGDSNFKTEFWKNAASISASKAISKDIQFPNLVSKSDVINQLKEILKLSSTNFEIVTFTGSFRFLLTDIGDFIFLNVNNGSISFVDIPAQVREIRYNANGSVSLKVWLYLMVPFPGYNSGAAGIVGGFDSVIEQD